MNKALIVGVNKYKYDGFKDLASVENDVKTVSEMFDKNFDDFHIQEVTGDKANSQYLKLEVERFLKNCDSQDTLILYWAGHGDVYNQKGYLIASDSTDDSHEFNKIEMNTLTEWIGDSPAKSILVLVDCCKSGYLTRSTSANSIDSAISKQLDIKGKGKVIISGTNDENAYSLDDDSNGQFTQIFIQSLEEYINKLDEKNDEVDITELYSSIVKDMEWSANRQIPCMKASIEGRFLLKLKSVALTNKNATYNNAPAANLTRGGILQIELLEKVFKRKYLDHKHFIRSIVEHVGVDLLAAKIVEVIPHALMEDFFHIEVEWFNWVRFSKIGLMRESFLLRLNRSEAEVIFKLVNDKNCFIHIKFSIYNENLIVEKLWAKIEQKEVTFPKSYTRNHTNKFEENMEDNYSWMSLTKDQRHLITFDNQNNLTKWNIQNREKLQTIKLGSESDELLIIGYSSMKNTVLTVGLLNDQYAYYLYNFLGDVIYKQEFDKGVKAYFPDSGEYIIFHDKVELMFASLLDEKIEKMYKFKKGFFVRKQYPLFSESTEEIFVYNYDRFLVFNKNFEYIKEYSIYNENICAITNVDLLVSCKEGNVQILDTINKTKEFPKLKLNEHRPYNNSRIIGNYFVEFRKETSYSDKHIIIEITDLTLSSAKKSNTDLFLIDGEPRTVILNEDKSFIAVLTKEGAIHVWE
ncbi:caspase family protein [Paenibacillus sp. FSL K6-1558]|uniref:caspase family protein n=1 Tax=Paenibacillus sp. FSL K6-1558 TaxID=2921473 RepID=UPI0030F79995